MTEPGSRHFAGDKAAAYDRARAPLASMYGALHRCTNAVLSSLDGASRVLCVGAGMLRGCSCPGRQASL